MSAPAFTRLFLLRHGEVVESWHGRVYGCLDVPLSARGEEEARQAAARLGAEPLAAVVSSGLARAEFGAALLREARGLERRDDPDLREIERGAWAGLSIEELAAEAPGAWEGWHADPGRLRPPCGESLADLAARVEPRLAHWARSHAGRAVAIVTHSWVIRLAVCRTLALGHEAAPRLDVPTGGMVVVEWPAADAAQRPTLSGFDVDRLPGGAAWFRAPDADGSR